MSRNNPPTLLILASLAFFCFPSVHPAVADHLSDTLTLPSGFQLQRRMVGPSLKFLIGALDKEFRRMEDWQSRFAVDGKAVDIAEFEEVERRLIEIDSDVCACCDEQRMLCSRPEVSAVMLPRYEEMERKYHEGMKSVFERMTALRGILVTLSGAERDTRFKAELDGLLDFIRNRRVEPPKIVAGTHNPTPQLRFIGSLPPAFFSGSTTPQHQVSSEDLTQTPEVQFTPRIQKLAEDLNRDPVTIYNYVKNNVDFEFYFLSKKGAEGTLIEKAGNGADQASLLIALYRSIGIPCRYVYGIIDLKAADALNWLNAESVQTLFERQKQQFMPVYMEAWGEMTVNGVLAKDTFLTASTTPSLYGRLSGAKTIRIEHIWVEAYLPYFNYRGAATADASQKFWISLDPALKSYDYVKAEDAFTKLGLNADGFIAQYLSDTSPDGLDESLEKKLNGLIQTAAPSNSLKDFLWSRRIRQESVTQLSNTFDSAVVRWGTWSDMHQLSDTFRATVTIELDNVKKKFLAAELYNKRVTISFKPSTTEDQQWLNEVGGSLKNVRSEFRMVAELRVEGVTVGKGTNEWAVGQGVPYRFTTFPLTFDRQLTLPAGGFYTICVNVGQVPKELVDERFRKFQDNFKPGADRDATFGEMTYISALQYWHWFHLATQQLKRLTNMGDVIMEPSVGMVRSDVTVTSLFSPDLATSVPAVNAITIDVPAGVSFLPRNMTQDARSWFGKLWTVNASSYEHIVFDRMFGIESLSTVKIPMIRPLFK